MAGDTVKEIKDRLSIQDVVAPYVQLKKAGKSLVGLCPFHKEKTPSFHVSLERGTWHCFGCGEGGDAFAFIEKIEGVDFVGAMKILAEKAGVTITYHKGTSKEENSKKARLAALMSRANDWYQSKLLGSPAQVYAKERGLSGDTIAAWQLGYAPEEWRVLLESLSSEGYSIQDLLAAGLVKEADGKPGTYYDRFRNRLMFPIKDALGHVVAFTGRALGADDTAKYLNSPETDLYHKSEVLFGLDRAKEAIRMRKYTMLVEGQIDVLHAHQAGFTNAVALSGTALTTRHLALMKRYSDNLMLVLDADHAGLTATARSASLALSEGMRVKAVSLPSGKDPADLLNEDPQEFAKRTTAAKPIIDFFLAELSAAEKDPHRLLRAVEGIVLPLIKVMKSPIERDHFIEITARTLGVSPEAVRESVARIPREVFAQRETQGKVAEVEVNIRSPREARGEELLAIVHAYPKTALAKRITAEYCRIIEAKKLPTSLPPESVLFQVEEAHGEDPEEGAADELLHAFEKAVVREAYEKAVNDLRRAELSADSLRIEEAQRLCSELSHRLALLPS